MAMSGRWTIADKGAQISGDRLQTLRDGGFEGTPYSRRKTMRAFKAVARGKGMLGLPVTDRQHLVASFFGFHAIKGAYLNGRKPNKQALRRLVCGE